MRKFVFLAACGAAILGALAMAGLIAVDYGSQAGHPAVLFFVAVAIGLTAHATLRSFAFTGWVLACVATTLIYPWTVRAWFGYDLIRLIVPLTQIIMFGMGTTRSPRDFARVAIFPWPVCVGVFLQFAVMPVTGYLIARSFGFEGEVAAGVVLIGSCSGGVASNLMAYLARGNVALSVTMTCISTFLSPLMTPLVLKQSGTSIGG